MYPTIPAALDALSAAGWTEIDNYRVGTFSARGGTLAVLTNVPDGGNGFTITAVALRRMTEDQAAEWEKAHPGVAEGAAPFALVGAKTGKPLPADGIVRGVGGTMRVFWSPLALEAFEGDGPEDDTAGPEDGAEDDAQPMDNGERLTAAMADPGSYHHGQHTMTTLKAYMAAGFTRDEAFELVLSVWGVMNQHRADHCIEGTACPMEHPQRDTDGEG